MSPGLERKESQRHELNEVETGEFLDSVGFGDDVALNEGRGDDKTGALDEERDGEGATGLGVEEPSGGEEKAAQQERDDGKEGFEPAIRVGDGLVARTQS